MKRYIYADNAATTKLDEDALASMMPFLQESYGNASQKYSMGVESRKAIEKARESIAACIGACPEEVFFTSGGTEGDNWAIKSIGYNSGKTIITSPIEHHAVLNSCVAIEKHSNIILLTVNGFGEVSVDELNDLLKSKTTSPANTLVSVMTVNNEIGTIEPIQLLAETAHSYGAIFHTDAVQAIGHMSINVHDLGVDLLTASAHKFNGPKGIGFTYVRKGTQLSSYLSGGAQESGYRAGTENVASIVGMAVALEKNVNSIRENEAHLLNLEQRFINKLDEAKLDYIRNGSINHVPGIISLSFKDSDGEMILHRLDLKGILISTGSACDSKNLQVSHVIKAIGVKQNYAEGTIRLSFGKNNSMEDIDDIAFELIRIFKRESESGTNNKDA